MRYRSLVILVAFIAVIGLSAPAAFAESNPSPTHGNGITATVAGPFHIIANDNTSVGITYPGTGDQATITSNPGTSYLEGATASTWVIHNSNGNCLRMRDANNNYAVMEESGCNTSDKNEQFVWTIPNSTSQFKNVATGQYLGVSCPAKNGNKVWGVTGNSGTCYNWQMRSS